MESIITGGRIPAGVLENLGRVNVLTDRVKKRRQECLFSVPHLCAERSRIVTECWKETGGIPLVLRRARLFQAIMQNITVSIRESELIVGSQSKYIRGAAPPIDYSPESLLATLGSEKLTLQGEVAEGAVTPEEKQSLLKDAEFWNGRAPGQILKDLILSQLPELEGYIKANLLNDGPFTTSCVGRCLEYSKILKLGIKGIRGEIDKAVKKLTFSRWGDWQKYEFLQAGLVCCDAFTDFIKRHAHMALVKAGKETNVERIKELELIAANCEWVSTDPPRTFYEALQLFWFIHLANNLESASVGGETPGRMDQYLFPYYEQDFHENRLTRQTAAELLGCLWIKFCEMVSVMSVSEKLQSQASQFQDLTIGGVTADGKDACNDLTFLIMEVTRQMKVTQPPVYLRYFQGINDEVMIKAMECNRDHGAGMPAFVNDAPALLNLTKRGVTLTEARTWEAAGCVGCHVPNGSTMGTAILCNKTKAFELALYNGVDPDSGEQLGPQTGDAGSFKSYDELYKAYLTQVEHLMDMAAKYSRLTEQIRSELFALPFASILLDDCIDRGTDYLQGGLRYPWLNGNFADTGYQNIADSLTAIKKLVFEDKKLSMDELLKALKTNFEDSDNICRMLLTAPKYGNDDDYADEIFGVVSLDSCRITTDHNDLYGKPMHLNRGGGSGHYWAGINVGALPDGRKANEPTGDANLSPVQGMDTHGPTAMLLSASKVNHTEYAMTTVLNMKIMPSMVQTREGMRKLISLVRTYFERGGWHIQFNMIDPEILIDAKKHPEQYHELMVRVAGFSAYFVELSPKVQDEIIARTLHSF